MITVYVREIEELQGHSLGDFAPGEIAGLVQVFQGHPVYTEAGDAASFVGTQFVATDDLYGGAAVFEILVRDEAAT